MHMKQIRTGIVRKLDGNMAVVETKYNAACEGCETKNSCKENENAFGEVKAINTIQAQVGDRVTVSIDSSSFLKVSFLVYIVPVLGLLGGALLGSAISRLIPISENLGGPMGGLTGFIASFLWVRHKGNKLAQQQNFTPAIVSVNANGCYPPRTTPPSSGPSCPSG